MAVDPLSVIAQAESRGRNVPNYKYGPGFTASGYYQIIDETWRRWAKAAGIDVSRYPTAMSAPPEVQHAVASQGYKMEGFRPWEATKHLVGQESNYGAPGSSGVISANGTAPSPAMGNLNAPAAATSAYNRADLNPYLVSGKSMTGVQDVLQERLGYLIGAMPENLRKGFGISSTYRSPERQRQLWEASDKSGHMVARPGHSQHETGNAFDLKFGSPEQQKWIHDNAAAYGLRFPMSYEKWHIEPVESRNSGVAFNAPWSGGAAPGGVMTATGDAPDAPIQTANATEAGTQAFNDAFAAVQQQEAAQAQQQAAQAQQQAAQDAQQQAQQRPIAGPGNPSQDSAASLMQSVLDKKRIARAGPVPGVLSAWSA